MNNLVKAVTLAFLLIAVSGCLNIEETYTVNPDGSGKVLHKSVIPMMNLGFPGQDSDPEKQMKHCVKEELEKAQGVDAWTDISFSLDGNDKLIFQGTAYFRDVSQLKFHNGGMSFNLFDRIEILPKGGQLILNITSSEAEEEDSSETEEQSPLSESEVAEKIQEIQAEMDKTRVMMAGVLSEFKIKRTFYLPGAVVKTMNLETAQDSSLLFHFSGEKLLSVMDSLFNDEEWMRAEIQAGRNPFKDKPEDDNMLNEKLFGQNAPVKAIVDVGEPLFDYNKEVSAAGGMPAAVLKDLGVMEKKKLERAPGSFRIGGVRLVAFSDMENEVRPFNYDEGYTLAVIGDLPDKVIKVTGGALTTALADNGENLLPKNEWSRNINFPHVSKDKKFTVFEVTLEKPSAAVKGIREVSGVLEYIVASGMREKDLQISSFTPGAEGTSYGAKIVSIQDSEWEPGKQQMNVEVSLSPERVESVKIFGPDDRPLQVSQGYSSMGGETTYHFTLSQGTFPETGRIVLEVHENPEKYEMPFKIENVSLSGAAQ